MNIAILIGISEYQNATSLNACKNDVNFISKLIKATNKYSDILYLDKETTSFNVKNKIVEFLKKYIDSQEKVEELFFYYSGHGLVLNDGFHYVLSDYDSKWINKTTYMNSELDDLIRSIKPKLTVKIVDACYSGVKYIKDISESEVRKAIDLSKDKLENCYFMYSSQNDEVSRATNEISLFTKSFIDSILGSYTEEIRYRDIIDYISDSFMQNYTGQTPYFVMQSNNTEFFGSISESIKKEIEEQLVEIGVVTQEGAKENKMEGVTLIDKIKFEAKEYCKDINEIQDIFGNMEKCLTEQKIDEQIDELFQFELNFLDEYYDEDDIEGLGKAAATLKEQENQYFIKLEYERKKVLVKKRSNPFSNIWEEDEYVEREKDILVRYNLTEQNVPFTLIRLTCLPKDEYPNLKKYSCCILFAFSKVYIKMIFNHIKYREIAFEDYKVDEMKWSKSEDIYIKNQEEVIENIKQIKNSFEKFILDDLHSEFNIERQVINLQQEEEILPAIRTV